MSISIDSLLGQAQKISQRRTAEPPLSAERKSVQPDQVEISTKMNTRLSAIDGDLRSVQDTMTKNQILTEGLKSLIDAEKRGDTDSMNETVRTTTYKNQAVLADFLGENQLTQSFLTSRLRDASEMLNKNYGEASKLAVEYENISAANPSALANPSDLFASSSIEGVATHNPDNVYRLTR